MDLDTTIRLTAFLGVFALMASWELMTPRRHWTIPKPRRWMANLSVAAVDTLVVRVLFFTGVVGMSIVASDQGWGILNHTQWPLLWELLIAVVVLDLVIYLQHLMFHAVPLFWRFHMVHHADVDYDVTTGVRFHPIESALSMLIKMVAVVAIGAPPVSVLTFEILLNATSMFNHSNVRIPLSMDRILRWVVVTPDMHRVHHSILPRERNRNFGFNLPWWDYLFGTYRTEPAHGQEGMTIGLEQFRDPARQTFVNLLMQPFIRGAGKLSASNEK